MSESSSQVGQPTSALFSSLRLVAHTSCLLSFFHSVFFFFFERLFISNCEIPGSSALLRVFEYLSFIFRYCIPAWRAGSSGLLFSRLVMHSSFLQCSRSTSRKRTKSPLTLGALLSQDDFFSRLLLVVFQARQTEAMFQCQPEDATVTVCHHLSHGNNKTVYSLTS